MDIKAQLALLKSTWGVVMSAVAAGPLALWTADLQPPWPAGSAVVATTACAVAIWLVLGLNIAISSSETLRRLGLGAFVAALALGSIYWSYSARYIIWIEVPTATAMREVPVVIGDELRPGLSDRNRSTRDVLLDNESLPEKVWTESSIRRAKLLLLVTFVGGFFFLTFGSAAIALKRSAGTRREDAE